MNRLLQLLLGLLALVPAACDSAGAVPEAEGGLTMLEVMIQIDLAYQQIEPNFRNPEAVAETEQAAESILAWTDDPLFEEFAKSERFIGDDRERYFALRNDMRAGAEKARDGAREADFDLLRQGFIEMKMSCIACHKRFSPAY